MPVTPITASPSETAANIDRRVRKIGVGAAAPSAAADPGAGALRAPHRVVELPLTPRRVLAGGGAGEAVA